jgi:hypothetical protein
MKNQLKLLLIFLFFLGPGTSYGALSKKEMIYSFNTDFQEILFDMRGSRGGNGDVAAGYLTIMDLIVNYGLHSHITVLVDKASEGILKRLAAGNVDFWSSIKTETLKTLPQKKQFDLYLALASPSGTFNRAAELQEKNSTGEAKINLVPNKKINIAKDGVMIVQTVLGNTENSDAINYPAVVRNNGTNYTMSPAGIGIHEAGIYSDYVAESLRDKTSTEISNYILSELPSIGDDFSRIAIEQILQNRVLKNSEIGLAYGISLKDTQIQFRSYLDGLSANSSKGYVIITPSGFNLKALGTRFDLHDRVTLINDIADLPEQTKPGHIYIVKVKTLPHKVFVGLIAKSMKDGLVPVGAGDGFLSAAIQLGGPFALTKVKWNKANLENISKRLENSIKQLEVKEFIHSVFVEADLKYAQGLKQVAPSFSHLIEEIPKLTERIMNAAILVREAPTLSPIDFYYATGNISDESLKNSVRLGGIQGELLIAKEIKWYEKFRNISLVDLVTFPLRLLPQNKRNILFSELVFKDKILERLLSQKFLEKFVRKPNPILITNEFKVAYIKTNVENATQQRVSDRFYKFIKDMFEFVSQSGPKNLDNSESGMCSNLFR